MTFQYSLNGSRSRVSGITKSTLMHMNRQQIRTYSALHVLLRMAELRKWVANMIDNLSSVSTLCLKNDPQHFAVTYASIVDPDNESIFGIM